MPRAGVHIKDVGGALAAFAVVFAIYGAAPLIGVLLSLAHSPYDLPPGPLDRDEPREAVYWEPPAPPVPVDASAPSDDPEPSEPPSETPDSTVDAEEPAVDEPQLASAVSPSDRRTVLRERARARRAARQAKLAASPPPPPPPPVELTAKEQRKEDREDRQEARRAERKQCAELIDQIVQVADDEWWFGRELVNCYRTHLEQFDMIGGAAWAEDDKGKKLGVKVFISKSVRGDPGRAAGFKSGDVIRKVNGVRTAGWAGVTVVSTQLLRGHVKVERLRKGEEQIVHLRVKDLDELQQAREAQQALADGEPGPERSGGVRYGDLSTGRAGPRAAPPRPPARAARAGRPSGPTGRSAPR
jgi:hypothetical protein